MPEVFQNFITAVLVWALPVIIAEGIIQGLKKDLNEITHVLLVFWPFTILIGIAISPFYFLYKLTVKITERVSKYNK